jgi:hypothetical protein
MGFQANSRSAARCVAVPGYAEPFDGSREDARDWAKRVTCCHVAAHAALRAWADAQP